MTSGAMFTTLVHKELRALAPLFLATLALVPLCALGLKPGLMTIGLGVYVLGACALGALSIGHEFTHDTLGQLLALPGSRARLLTVKLMVLAALLTILAAAATLTLWAWGVSVLGVAWPDAAEALRWPVVVVPALLALCVAPVLTMVGKGAIAGTVFTLALYAGLWMFLPGVMTLSGPQAADVPFYGPAMLRMAIAISGAAAVAGTIAFGRLEVTGAAGPTAWILHRANVASTRTSVQVRRRPVRVLLQKEVRVQTVSFAVAGLYVVAWTLMPVLGGSSGQAQYVFSSVTILYQLSLAVLVGALASAKERTLGTCNGRRCSHMRRRNSGPSRLPRS